MGRPSWRDWLFRLQAFGGIEAPGRFDGFLKYIFLRSFEQHGGRAPASPGAFDGSKRLGMIPRKIVLIFRRELHHGSGLIGIAERGEDFSSNAEIGMVHVLAFFGFRQ